MGRLTSVGWHCANRVYLWVLFGSQNNDCFPEHHEATDQGKDGVPVVSKASQHKDVVEVRHIMTHS